MAGSFPAKSRSVLPALATMDEPQASNITPFICKDIANDVVGYHHTFFSYLEI